MTTLPTFAGVQPVHHFQAAVFVLSAGAHTVYMYEEAPAASGEIYAVVVVDAARFLQLWRQPGSSHPEVAHQGPATWPQDRKFHWPDGHFRQGRANPVPLATVGCALRRIEVPVWRRRLLGKVIDRVDVVEQPVLSFTDGVTRTIWLLANGAGVMPVKCLASEAALLQQLAGVDGGQPATVGALFKRALSDRGESRWTS